MLKLKRGRDRAVPHQPTGGGNSSGRMGRRTPLRDFLIVLGILVAIGYLLAFLGDPFVTILYAQSAFAVAVLALFWLVRRDAPALSVLGLFILAYALNKPAPAVALGVLFFVLFTGRSFLAAPAARRIFSLSAILLAGLLYVLVFVASRTSVHSRSSEDEQEELEAMNSLPYQSSVEGPQAANPDGVVVYNKKAAAPGLNLYNSYYRAGAYLLDMEGRTIHAWRPTGLNPRWHFVALCGDGDLLVCIEDRALVKLDWNSAVVWERPMRAHHEIAVAGSGDIYTLTSEEEVVFVDLVPLPIINDYIVLLDGGGTVKKKISVFDLLRREIAPIDILRIYARILDPRDLVWKALRLKKDRRYQMDRGSPFDPFHDNTITPAERDIAGVCRRGDILISASARDLIGVVDAAAGRMRWTWGSGKNGLEGQHNPTFLANGNVLIFDNGLKREFSRLIELDPLKKDVVWDYHSLHPTPFFTSWGGAAERLPNGNTLVTESGDGRVFEITRDEQIVWEFYNPDRTDEGKRATIYKMTKITDPNLIRRLIQRATAGR